VAAEEAIAEVGKVIAQSLSGLVGLVSKVFSTGPAPAATAPSGGATSSAPANTTGIDSVLRALSNLNKVTLGLSGAMGSLLASVVNITAPSKALSERYAKAVEEAAKASEDYQKAVKAAAAAQEAVKDARLKANFTGRAEDVEAAKQAESKATAAQTDVEKKAEIKTKKAQDAEAVKPSGLAEVAAAISGIAAVATAAVGAIEQVIGQLKGFVEALNPALINQFNRAMRDLQATVGVAFEPIFEVLTGTFRQVAGLILPVMEELRPVVQQLTESFAATLIPQVKLAVSIFSALAPVLRVIASLFTTLQGVMQPIFGVLQLFATGIGFLFQLLEVALLPLTEALKVVSAFFEGFSELLNVVNIVFSALVKTVADFIKSLLAGFNFKGIADLVTSTFKKLIEAMLLFIGSLAKFFGANKFLKNLIEGLSPKSGAVAGGPASISSFEQISKDLAVAAATATGTSGEAEKKSDLGDVVKQLRDIERGGDSGFTKLVNKIDELIDTFKGTKDKAVTYVKEAATTTTNLATNPLVSPIGWAARKLLGG